MFTNKITEINRFSGDYFFLSNFYVCPFEYNQRTFPTSEHAFQAMKTKSPRERDWFTNKRLTPADAKHLGRSVTFREDWNEIRISVMYSVVKKKFDTYRGLQLELINTGNAKLIEGNEWKDIFWGVYRGRGENNLGKILMELRGIYNAKTRVGTKDITSRSSQKANEERAIR